MVCPHCSQPRSADAVICIHCGFDFRTGKKAAASPKPQHFGDFSLVPQSRGEWSLNVRQRFLGIAPGHANISSRRRRKGVLRYPRFLDAGRRAHGRPRYDEVLVFRDVCTCRTGPQVISASVLRVASLLGYQPAVGQFQRDTVIRGGFPRAARSLLASEAEPELGGDPGSCRLAFRCSGSADRAAGPPQPRVRNVRKGDKSNYRHRPRLIGHIPVFTSIVRRPSAMDNLGIEPLRDGRRRAPVHYLV